MEFIVLLIIVIVVYLILRFIFDFNVKKIKELGEDKELDKLTQKYPENVEICKWYLKKLKNKNVKIEEDKNSNATLYLVMSNKIFIANLKESYTRIQTIAHECLHSIQSKKLLRTYLENDAMIKARFLAKEYMQEEAISTREEIDKIVNKYDELNDIGIRCTNFQFLSNILVKIIILAVIFLIR